MAVINTTYEDFVYGYNNDTLQDGDYRFLYETIVPSTVTAYKASGLQFYITISVTYDELTATSSFNNLVKQIERVNSADLPGANLDLWQVYWNETGEDGTKGWIYSLKDEWDNIAPYDFKSIQFLDGENYVYTFDDGASGDLSVTQTTLCRDNRIYGSDTKSYAVYSTRDYIQKIILRPDTDTDEVKYNNIVYTNQNIIVKGEFNTIYENCNNVTLVGDHNTLKAGNDVIDVNGNSNILGENNENITIQGDENILGSDSKDVTIIGNSNQVDESTTVVITGDTNTVIGSTDTTITGQGNTVSGSTTTVIEGNNNDTYDSTQTDIKGDGNATSDSSGTTIVEGSGNTISGSTDTTITGGDGITVNPGNTDTDLDGDDSGSTIDQTDQGKIETKPDGSQTDITDPDNPKETSTDSLKEAPIDNEPYVRRNKDWSKLVAGTNNVDISSEEVDEGTETKVSVLGYIIGDNGSSIIKQLNSIIWDEGIDYSSIFTLEIIENKIKFTIIDESLKDRIPILITYVFNSYINSFISLSKDHSDKKIITEIEYINGNLFFYLICNSNWEASSTTNLIYLGKKELNGAQKADGVGSLSLGEGTNSKGNYSLSLGYGGYRTLSITGVANSTTYTVADSDVTIIKYLKDRYISSTINYNITNPTITAINETNKTITVSETLNPDSDFSVKKVYWFPENTAGECSIVSGWGNIDLGSYSFINGENNNNTGVESLIIGHQTTTSSKLSLNLGSQNNCAGNYGNFAGGLLCATSGDWGNIAFGEGTTASGRYCASFGRNNESTNLGSFATGRWTSATGQASFSAGEFTKAAGQDQFVLGHYNVEDADNKYAFIIGGGTEADRKNITTIDWEGNLTASSDVVATKSDGTTVSLIDVSTVTGITEAPIDGKLYGRKDATWEEISNVDIKAVRYDISQNLLNSEKTTARNNINAETVISLTQTEYDNLSDDEKTASNTTYVITDAESLDTYTKTDVDNLLTTKADDTKVVHKEGEETVSGAKEFTGANTYAKALRLVGTDQSTSNLQSATTNIYIYPNYTNVTSKSGWCFSSDGSFRPDASNTNRTIGSASYGLGEIYMRDGNSLIRSNTEYLGFGNKNGNLFSAYSTKGGGETVTTGALYPLTNDKFNLGTTSLKWKNAYLTGVLYVPTIGNSISNLTILSGSEQSYGGFSLTNTDQEGSGTFTMTTGKTVLKQRADDGTYSSLTLNSGALNLESEAATTISSNSSVTINSYHSNKASTGYYTGCNLANSTIDLSTYYKTASSTTTKSIRFSYSNGALYPTASNTLNLGTTSYRWKYIYSNNALQVSDKREKKDIEQIDLQRCKDWVDNTNAYTFKYNDDEEQRQRVGLIAQEVQQYIPEAVVEADDEKKTLSLGYSDLVAPLLAVVKDLRKEVAELKERVAKLEAEKGD